MTIPAEPRYRRRLLHIAGALMIAGGAATLGLPGSVQAESPAATMKLKAKPKPPQPGKEVFVRTKPHVNVGPSSPKPQGPASLKGQVPVLHDWYCGEGSGPGGHAVCTQDLINSCSGTYVPPKTNGEHQTWGMCHESSGG